MEPKDKIIVALDVPTLDEEMRAKVAEFIAANQFA